MTLSEKRKADRAQMATALAMLAGSLGARVEIENMSTREIWVSIAAARGLRVTVDFDGGSWQPDVHVISWHIASDSDAKLSDAFGDINRFHFAKSTDVAHGFDELCEIVARRLEQAASGAAFNAKREADCIAKAGETAAERNARYGRGFDAIAAAHAAGVAVTVHHTAADARAFVDKWAPIAAA